MRIYNVLRNMFKPREDLSKYLVLLDAGHGGIVNGEYVTKGKRSPVWADGYVLYEGVENRIRRDYVCDILTKNGIRVEYVNKGDLDMPLKERSKRVNELAKENGIENTLCFSIHSNGHDNEKANGYEIYTSVGQTNADICASFVFSNIKSSFPDRKMRVDVADGDPDKEINFWMVHKTICPSVLTEDFFHTNEYECNFILRDDDMKRKIAECHAKGIIEYFEYLNHKRKI